MTFGDQHMPGSIHLNPGSLNWMASYDVASDTCQALTPGAELRCVDADVTAAVERPLGRPLRHSLRRRLGAGAYTRPLFSST
jgi:hypothetical protein